MTLMTLLSPNSPNSPDKPNRFLLFLKTLTNFIPEKRGKNYLDFVPIHAVVLVNNSCGHFSIPISLTSLLTLVT